MKLLCNAPFRLSDLQRREWAAIRPGLEIIEVAVDPPERLEGDGVEILVTEKVPRNLEAWGRLRWVQLLSAGANQLLDHPIQRTGIPVTTASGTHGVPIAQFVTAAWLMMAHRFPQLLRFKETRIWPNRLALGSLPIRGLTAGIVGYGSIGRECARQLQALGLRIICQKRDPAARRDEGYTAWPGTGDPEGVIPDAWYGPEQLDAVLEQSDLLVVTVPSTPRTHGLIGRRELARLKAGARIIVVSRGGVVVERDLADAVLAGHVAEAVVDCFEQEPLPADHFYFNVPNLILTPHMSGVYEGFWPHLVGLVGENLRRYVRGAPLLNRTSPELGY